MTESQVHTALTFGEFFRTKRVGLGLTLRTFSERFGYDPGNISRLERNILPPSLDDEKLLGYATALQIKEDSQDWVMFHDLAHAAKGKLPKDIENDKEAINMLPAFFRTMRNKKIDRQKLEKLVELLKNE